MNPTRYPEPMTRDHRETEHSWSDRLHRVALATLGSESPQHLGEVVREHLTSLPVAWLLARSLGAAIEPSTLAPRSLDESLWAALAGASRIPPAPAPAAPKPLTGEGPDGTIEVWTETELACVHAAWSLGPAWRAAVKASALWLVEHIQPDNATNHPWAVHVFAALGAETQSPEIELYAQTLLHNCIVGSGRPDPYSALILLHASRALQTG